MQLPQYGIESDRIPSLVADARSLVIRPIRVDELDCRKSFQRQPTKLSLEDALALAQEYETPWTFIHRQAFGKEQSYYELGCRINSSAVNGVEYFIWIEVSELDGSELAAKHGLAALPY